MAPVLGKSRCTNPEIYATVSGMQYIKRLCNLSRMSAARQSLRETTKQKQKKHNQKNRNKQTPKKQCLRQNGGKAQKQKTTPIVPPFCLEHCCFSCFYVCFFVFSCVCFFVVFPQHCYRPGPHKIDLTTNNS